MQDRHTRNAVCPICGAKIQKTSLKSHLQTHAAFKSFPCPYPDCGKQFIGQKLLKDHMNSHTGVRPYVCSRCEKTYLTSASLNHHRKSCGIKVSCNECGMVFASVSSLSDHKKAVHVGNIYICKCGKIFKWRSNHTRHRKQCPEAEEGQSSVAAEGQIPKAEGQIQWAEGGQIPEADEGQIPWTEQDQLPRDEEGQT